MKRIKQISVEGLFGTLNHSIPLHMEDRITIIHGLNGVGKTVILRLLDELFSRRNIELRKIPFTKFQVELDDNSCFWVTKVYEKQTDKDGKSPINSTLTFHWTKPGGDLLEFELSNKRWQGAKEEAVLRSFMLIEDDIPELVHISASTWVHQLSGESFSPEELLESFGYLLSNRFTDADQPTEPEWPEWLEELRQSLCIRLIETQRLLSVEEKRRLRRPRVMEPTVKKYAEELAENIKTKRDESGAKGQVLDKTFPKRVFEPTIFQKSISVDELHKKLTEQDEKRLRLMAAGLLDQDNSDAFQMDKEVSENQKIMLSVYVEDMEEKLRVFDEISRKINLLTKIINGKQFLNKEMAITKDLGFVFTSTNGETIPLNNLSSGEQNQLVLFYDLLFKTRPGSLILLDEPETSLHIVWQQEFLQDIRDIIELTNIDVMMATHSPDLIHKSWNLTVGLEGSSIETVHPAGKDSK